MKRLITLAFIFMAAFSGCSGEDGAEDKGLLIPIQGDYIRYAAQIQELSGLCLHTDGSFIWGVGDQGTLAKISFDGEANTLLATYKVPYGGNCESVCLDYNNSCVWVADDDDNSKLYKINFTF